MQPSYRVMYYQMRSYPLFLRYLFGTFLSGIGDLATTVALMWFLTTHAAHPAVYLSLVGMAAGLIYPTTMNVAGYWVDRFGYVRVARLTVLTRTALWTGFVLLWVLVGAHSPTLALRLATGILIVDTAVSPFLRPVDSALTQQVVAVDHRAPANALHGMQYEITYLVGPLMGGVLAARHVLIVALVFNILSFVVLGWVFFTMPEGIRSVVAVNRPTKMPLSAKARGFIVALVAGVKTLWAFKGLGGIVLLGFWWNVWILGPVEVLFPLLAHEFHGSAVSYSSFLVANSLGFLGGLIFWARVRVPRPWGWRYAGVLMLDGVVYAIVGFSHSLWIAWFLIGLGGFITAPTAIWGSTLRQELIPSEFQGRVSALAGFIGFLGAPLGSVLVLLVLHGFRWPLSTCFLAFGGMLALGAAITTQLRVMRST